MAQFPALPLWTDAYLGDTSHLTTLEHGAYLLLLMAMWRAKDNRLPNDNRLLARYCGLRLDHWNRISPIIMPFFDVNDGYLTQGRLTDEAALVRENSRVQSQKAKSRWRKKVSYSANESEPNSLTNQNPTDAAAMPGEYRGNAPTPTPTIKSPPPNGGTVLPFPNGNGTATAQLGDSSSSPPKPARPPSRPPGFDEFWAAYPRKVGKGHAVKAYEKALAKASPEMLVAAVKAQSPSWTDPQFIKHPKTWLNAECWLDEVAKPKYPAWGATMP